MSQYAEYWQGIAIRKTGNRCFYITATYQVGDWWVTSFYRGGCANNIRSYEHYFFNDKDAAERYAHWKRVQKERDGYC